MDHSSHGGSHGGGHGQDQMQHTGHEHHQMDHSQMDHAQMDHAQMDHAQMDHSAHAAHGAQGAHGVHGAHGAQGSRVPWSMAIQATLHCLLGCAIGEVLGMVLGTAFGLHNAATVVLSVALAFVFGYALTMRGVLRAGVDWRTAVKVALAADTVSIAVMELLDNTVMVTVPGAMDAGLTSALFWGALAFSLVVAFLVTTPVNRWLIGRGKGHAVVHQYH
ncbi:DUF4396 domain-containing protein [Hamadaea sp. NPDC051192]|uniref:DUF4396 domain-containing protein n=1 Tax=Hamadaea sp. NPDC051192 TaxID=3154940 RepID=UPI003422FED4